MINSASGLEIRNDTDKDIYIDLLLVLRKLDIKLLRVFDMWLSHQEILRKMNK